MPKRTDSTMRSQRKRTRLRAVLTLLLLPALDTCRAHAGVQDINASTAAKLDQIAGNMSEIDGRGHRGSMSDAATAGQMMRQAATAPPRKP